MDLFYYGSQDVPLPLGRGGDRTNGRSRGEAPVYCESCSAPVPEGEVKGGRATEMFGLILCETCRMKASAEERIELYFCDRCQVSVPVYRVDTGEALAGDGRILCISCREKSTRGGRFVRAGVLALLFFALLSLGLMFAPDGMDAAAPPSPDVGALVRSALDSELGDLGIPERSAVLLDGLEGLDTALAAARESRAAAMAGLSDAQGSYLRLSSAFDDRMTVLEAEAARFDRQVESLLIEVGPKR